MTNSKRSPALAIWDLFLQTELVRGELDSVCLCIHVCVCVVTERAMLERGLLRLH